MPNTEHKWLKGAINKKHKGWCTPLSNPHCTGRQRALALRFKKGDLHSEGITATEIVDTLLEHCGHCPEDEPGDVTEAECPTCGGPGVLLGSLGRVVWFRCRNCGQDFSEPESGQEVQA